MKAYSHFSDEALMQEISKKNSLAFKELYNRYKQKMLYYFYKMLGKDEIKAQDFLQDLFMKIIEKPHLFDSKLRFSTWIYAVAYNACKNEYRKEKVRKIIDKEADASEVGFLENQNAIDLKDFKIKLLEALEQLSESQKSTFLMRHRAGFSIKEISEAMNCQEGTTKSRLYHANKKLAEQLKIYKNII